MLIAQIVLLLSSQGDTDLPLESVLDYSRLDYHIIQGLDYSKPVTFSPKATEERSRMGRPNVRMRYYYSILLP
jgi:hypothetical protein